MRSAIDDSHRGPEAYGIAKAVHDGKMGVNEANRRFSSWREAWPLVSRDPPPVEELTVTSRKPSFAERQLARARYALEDLLTPPSYAGRYPGFKGGGFEPGQGVADMEDLRRQQQKFGRIKSGRARTSDIHPGRPPQTVPDGMSLGKVQNDAAALFSGFEPGPMSAETAGGQWPYVLGQWVNRVRPGGAWDFKRNGQRQFEQFGNEAYGVTGNELGLPPEILKRGAGAAQLLTGSYDPAFGVPWGGAPYGDDPWDQQDIQRGIDWRRARLNSSRR